MLAQAIDEAVTSPSYAAADYAAEWKWDGIRVQAVHEGGQRRLYTRTGDDIPHTFPDVLAALDFEGVIDGELLVIRDGQVAPFADLQQRLNRKTVDAKLMATIPPASAPTTCCWMAQEDMRSLPFAERRKRLEAFVARLAQRPHRPVAAAAVRELGGAGAPCAPTRRPAIRRSPRG